MESELLLVVVATPVALPGVIERRRWPVHVTVAGNFRLDVGAVDDAAALLDSVASRVPSFDVVLGPGDRFGAAQKIPVLLAEHPNVHSLHDSLAGLRGLAGFVEAEPAFWGSGYRPHATIGHAVRARDGDILPIRVLTLVSLDGGTAQPVRATELA